MGDPMLKKEKCCEGDRSAHASEIRKFIWSHSAFHDKKSYGTPFLISFIVNSQPKLPDSSIKRSEVGSNSQDGPGDDEVTGHREFEYGENSLN